MGKLSDATRDKLKGVSTATICTALYKRGLRKAIVSFGPPVLAEPGVRRHAAAEIMTETLQQRVQRLLDDINSSDVAPQGDPETVGPSLPSLSEAALQLA